MAQCWAMYFEIIGEISEIERIGAVLLFVNVRACVSSSDEDVGGS